jgi:hypothetical protein
LAAGWRLLGYEITYTIPAGRDREKSTGREATKRGHVELGESWRDETMRKRACRVGGVNPQDYGIEQTTTLKRRKFGPEKAG